jgi:hypothetical protein
MIVARHEYVFSALLNCSIVLVVLRTRSYRTLRDGSFEGRFSRHFVPGYDQSSLRDALADISQQHHSI